MSRVLMKKSCPVCGRFDFLILREVETCKGCGSDIRLINQVTVEVVAVNLTRTVNIGQKSEEEKKVWVVQNIAQELINQLEGVS